MSQQVEPKQSVPDTAPSLHDVQPDLQKSWQSALNKEPIIKSAKFSGGLDSKNLPFPNEPRLPKEPRQLKALEPSPFFAGGGDIVFGRDPNAFRYDQVAQEVTRPRMPLPLRKGQQPPAAEDGKSWQGAVSQLSSDKTKASVSALRLR